MRRFAGALGALAAAWINAAPLAAQEITPEQLAAMVDARAASSAPMMALLNDPNPQRALAAVELMLESEDARLRQMAVDVGLLSAAPEVRRAAFLGFLRQRPVLIVSLDIAEADLSEFEAPFKNATDGTLHGAERATFAVNVGSFEADKNCFLLTGTDRCAISVAPTGATIYKQASWTNRHFVRVILEFGDPGQLTGAARVNDVAGGFPARLEIVQ